MYVPALETARNPNIHKASLRHSGQLLKVLLHAQFTVSMGANKRTINFNIFRPNAPMKFYAPQSLIARMAFR